MNKRIFILHLMRYILGITFFITVCLLSIIWAISK